MTVTISKMRLALGVLAVALLIPATAYATHVFDDVSDNAGVLMEPLAVGMHAALGSRPFGAGPALVIGSGPIALGAIWALTMAGMIQTVPSLALMALMVPLIIYSGLKDAGVSVTVSVQNSLVNDPLNKFGNEKQKKENIKFN